jgi:hypothetical protein
MTSRQARIGTVLAIAMGDGRFAFGRLLRPPLVEFYDLAVEDLDDIDVDEIARAPVAFRIWVMDKAVSGRSWKKIGAVPLRDEEISHREVFFKRDAVSGELSTYWSDPDTGEVHERPASLADCEQLEAAAVWSAGHVEDRLLDHFLGRENSWVQSLRPR